MSKLKKLKNGLRIVVKTAKKNAGDETGALTTIELVVLLMGILTPYYGVSIKCIT